MDITEFITSQVNNNEFFQGAALTTILASLLMYAKNIPFKIHNFIYRRVVYSVTAEETQILHDVINTFLLNEKKDNIRRAVAKSSIKTKNSNHIDYNASSASTSDPAKPKVLENEYEQNDGVTYLFKYGTIFKITKFREKREHAYDNETMYFSYFRISTLFSFNKLKKFIDYVSNEYYTPAEKVPKILSPDGTYWLTTGKIKNKSIENIILPESIKNKILTDLNTFNAKEDWYESTAIPYKRGYLFHGIPGNGKTSLAMALATLTKRDLYVLNLADISSEHQLIRLFTNLSSNDGILLIEDVDAIYAERNAKSKVSFSALLNILDGAHSKHGLITIMTTNHIDRLDEALVRPGRIDTKIEITSPKKPQVEEFLKRFYGNDIILPNYNKDHTYAELQGMCLQNNCNSILNQITDDV